MAELFRALLLIFVAEMGDKTQILAMAFATKYKIKQVVLGILIGSFLNHALAVLLGANLYKIIPISALGIIAGFSFLLFGLWNLKMDDEDESKSKTFFGPISTVALAFFIGELGDKTQLTAIILATDAVNPVFILIGTVSGMVLTGLLGIFVGIKLGNKVDEFYIKIVASTVFFVFGYIKLIGSLPTTYLSVFNITFVTLILLFMSYVLLKPTVALRRLGRSTEYQRTATRLHNFYNTMYNTLEDICLGENHCGVCGGTNCLIGFNKKVIEDAKNGLEINTEFIENKLTKNFSRSKVLEALKDTIELLKDSFELPSMKQVHSIRKNFELIMYKETIDANTYKEYIDKLTIIDSNLVQLLK